MLHPAADLQSVFGSLCKKAVEFAEANPVWQGEMSNTVLYPHVFTETEQRSITYIKHAVQFLKSAAEKSPEILPSEILIATKQIDKSLQIFQN